MITREEHIALNTFGMGPRFSDVQNMNGNPKQWILGQIHNAKPPILTGAMSASGVIQAFSDVRQTKDSEIKKAMRKDFMTDSRETYKTAIGFSLKHAILSDNPFLERLVAFWANHFTVSARERTLLYGLVGPYENEAIRPNILGSFYDLLHGVVRHPAMLLYLDNVQSIGPNSLAGKRSGERGLNENLAREILELHTLGVNGGYTQKDVIEFAKILTGWSLGTDNESFIFRRGVHEPGDKFLLGKRFGAGVSEGRKALRFLASHPSTARFICKKLAVHFIQDEPAQPDIDNLVEVYLKTEGDLPSLYSALLDLDSVWNTPADKIKSPFEFVVSTARVLNMNETHLGEETLRRFYQTLVLMNHQPYAAASPAGWDDNDSAWISPDSVMNRLEWCYAVANYVPAERRLYDWILSTVRPVMDDDDIAWINKAPSLREGIALLLASPAHQRR